MSANATEQTLEILEKTYPHARIALSFSNTWELLVAVVLSAQCTDVMVNKVTEKLFKKYPTLDEYVEARIDEFEQDIKSTGFYHNKAKNILASSRIISEKFNGKVPDTMEKLLLLLPGIARKSANIILGNAYGVIEGIAVDTHVSRVSQRLRLVDPKKIGGKNLVYFTRQGSGPRVDFKKDADPVKIEQSLMATVAKEEWFQISYRLIDHGRQICHARRPLCERCVLNRICPSSRV
ncbi:MAG: endonuclease III [bacterium]|nr:endonuclease III [bacterium]